MNEDTKNAKWVKLGDNVTLVMPSGKEVEFDFSLLTNDAVFAYYGKKQWLSDKMASAKGTPEEDKIALIQAAFTEAVENGVQLSNTGKVQIIGKERANAKPKTQDNKVLEGLSTYTEEEIAALKVSIKLGLIKVSDKVQEMINSK